MDGDGDAGLQSMELAVVFLSVRDFVRPRGTWLISVA